MKILIIDDSKAMRTFLGHLVSELHLASAEADDGLHGLEVLRATPDIDVALVDWDMPRMNGFEFVQAVRADPRFAELKLMMVTTQNSMDRVAAALHAGANDFLMKPVSLESLEDKLRLLGVVA